MLSETEYIIYEHVFSFSLDLYSHIEWVRLMEVTILFLNQP